MKRVLYPTDFSKASEQGIEALRDLKKIGVHEVVLIHVVDLNKLLGPISGIDIPAVISDYEKEAFENLEHFSKSIERLGLNVITLEPKTGEPSVVISDTALEVDADMIVIPSYGKGFISGLLLGSVSEGVVRRSKKPVLVIKSVPTEIEERETVEETLFKRIVIGFDFSKSSEKMIEYALIFAEKGQSERVIIVHILEKKDRIDDHKLKKLEEIKDLFQSKEIETEVVVEKGTPYKEILRISEEKKGTMIAVSSKGEGFVRFLLGGTADGIVRRSKIPVFVYKE